MVGTRLESHIERRPLGRIARSSKSHDFSVITGATVGGAFEARMVRAFSRNNHCSDPWTWRDTASNLGRGAYRLAHTGLVSWGHGDRG
jgi:hypothetical protein